MSQLSCPAQVGASDISSSPSSQQGGSAAILTQSGSARPNMVSDVLPSPGMFSSQNSQQGGSVAILTQSGSACPGIAPDVLPSPCTYQRYHLINCFPTRRLNRHLESVRIYLPKHRLSCPAQPRYVPECHSSPSSLQGGSVAILTQSGSACPGMVSAIQPPWVQSVQMAQPQCILEQYYTV
jgi:hypothetical protein